MPQSKSNTAISHPHLGREAVIQKAFLRLNRRRRRSQGPPPVMTWGKALPIVIVAFIFDLVRIFFEWFWFFGPALAMVACTGAGGAILKYVWLGTKTAAAVCGAGLAVAEYLGIGVPIEAFGILMAEAVALMGWLTIGFWVFTTNARLFKENGEDITHMVLLYLSILISFIPILGTAPTVGWITYKLFKFQIKIEGEALKQYEEEQAAALAEERQQQQVAAAEFIQARALQQAQAAQSEQQEAEDEAMYAQAALG